MIAQPRQAQAPTPAHAHAQQHEFINSHCQQMHAHTHTHHHATTRLHQQALPVDYALYNDVLYVNVGGRIFTTTKTTLKRSALFARVFNANNARERASVGDVHSQSQSQSQSQKRKKSESQSAEIEFLDDDENATPVVRTAHTTFDSYCVQHLDGAHTARPVDVTAAPAPPLLQSDDNDNDDHKQQADDVYIDTAGIHCVYQMNVNVFFVDRSPEFFGDILHFLRSSPKLSAEHFVQRYYGGSSLWNTQSPPFGARRTSPLCASAVSSCHSLMDVAVASNGHAHRVLLKLQDEAIFYGLNALTAAIQERLEDARSCKEVSLRLMANDSNNSFRVLPCHSCSSNQNTLISMTTVTNNVQPAVGRSSPQSRFHQPSIQSPLVLGRKQCNISWWDRDGPHNGLRRVAGTRIAFAVSMDNWVDKDCRFDAPPGFVWASQAMYLDEFYKRRDILCKCKEWVHFGLGGWHNYLWKYARKIAFNFCDTFRAQRFVHSGMEVCDINHVKSLYGVMAGSQLMEYDENRGIVEGFAGLVLLSDQVWHGEDDDDDDDAVLPVSNSAVAAAHNLACDVVLSSATISNKTPPPPNHNNMSNSNSDTGAAPQTQTPQVVVSTAANAAARNNDVFSIISSAASSLSNHGADHDKNNNDNEDATNKHKHKHNKNDKMLEIPPPLDDCESTSSWTSDENDEQIRSLIKQHHLSFHESEGDDNNGNDTDNVEKPRKRKSNPFEEHNAEQPEQKKQKDAGLHPIHHQRLIPAASAPYPNLPPPLMASPDSLRSARRYKAVLTQKNLEQHTKLEHLKHTQKHILQHQTQQPQPQSVAVVHVMGSPPKPSSPPDARQVLPAAPAPAPAPTPASVSVPVAPDAVADKSPTRSHLPPSKMSPKSLSRHAKPFMPNPQQQQQQQQPQQQKPHGHPHAHAHAHPHPHVRSPVIQHAIPVPNLQYSHSHAPPHAQHQHPPHPHLHPHVHHLTHVLYPVQANNVPQPGLVQRLSVHSLPPQATSHHLNIRHQSSKTLHG